jgi:hypothetical protein
VCRVLCRKCGWLSGQTYKNRLEFPTGNIELHATMKRTLLAPVFLQQSRIYTPERKKLAGLGQRPLAMGVSDERGGNKTKHKITMFD